MATPRVAAGALIRDAQGRVLLVKPTYKDGWDIPGGYVEPGESPAAACRRELKEELQIDLIVGRLLLVDWAPAPNEGDKLLFVFDGGTLADSSAASPDHFEIGAVRFVALSELGPFLPGRLERRISSAMNTVDDVYAENGLKTIAV